MRTVPLVVIVLLALAGCGPSSDARAPSGDRARVVRVTDGDTFVARIGTRDERVRVVGIDTPELAQNGGNAECYGPEAAQRTRRLLEDATVTLERDALQADRDIYGRLLRHVRLPDGRLLGETLLVEGFATVYRDQRGHDRLEAYRAAEQQAREDGAGMWGACGR